ncbi:hypothetical protein R3P38DRAFT_3373627 [Favolaschia claudopus]|uniref:Uncharacterized protein n=1 Tax=Favolaschia claudopus TaxID=2862362 RepID=A0AAV9ZRF1_9AGAR
MDAIVYFRRRMDTCVPLDLPNIPDYIATDLIETEIPNWRNHIFTTFTKDHIKKAAGLGKSSTNEVYKLIANGLKLDHPVAQYLKHGGLDSTDSEIKKLEAQYNDMAYGDFKGLVNALVDANSHKPTGSKGKGKAKPKRQREAGDDDDEPLDKRHKKIDKKRGKERKKLMAQLAALQARIGEYGGDDEESMNSDNLDDDSDS